MRNLLNATFRGSLYTFLLIGVIVVMATCLISITSNGAPTPTARITPTPYGYYTATLTSPNGAITVVRECAASGLDEDCVWQLPNGKVIPDVTRVYWSADNRYAVICHRATHDSVGCLEGHAVWDMTKGMKLSLQIEGNAPAFKWQQHGDILAYYPAGYPESYKEPRRLTLFNAETGEVSFPDKCPDWLLMPSLNSGATSGDDGSWQLFCKQAFASTLTP